MSTGRWVHHGGEMESRAQRERMGVEPTAAYYA